MNKTPVSDEVLSNYAKLIVRVGLNLQPDQRLLILAPIEATALARMVATQAYQAGASLVDVLWQDRHMRLIRLQHARRESLTETWKWRNLARMEAVEQGGAYLTIDNRDPDLLRGQDPEAVAMMERADWHDAVPFFDQVSRQAINWTIAAVPSPNWAARVFPSEPVERQEPLLWSAILRSCRLDQPDPLAAWKDHVAQLTVRCDFLNAQRYTALHFRGPGTDLKVGLPTHHFWQGARFVTRGGIPYTANLPSEEIFTLPHQAQVEGFVTASRPLSYAETLIEDFTLTFEGGRVIRATAAQGEALLHQLLESDEGASRLGEVALVPHSSPISQAGILFFNTLFDENAASHLALGRAYDFSLRGGTQLSQEEIRAAGANHSIIHVDFMIGNGETDVDGIDAGGMAEPIMRSGEWAFTV